MKKEPTSQIKLYNGKIVIDFWERWHRYEIKGEKLISVTSATSIVDKSRPLIFWAVGLSRDFLINKLQKGEWIKIKDILEASKQHTIRKKEAADVGTLTHEWAESYIKSWILGTSLPEYPQDEKVYNGCIAFLKWQETHEVHFLEAERVVYSRTHHYVGKMDCKAIVDGEMAAVDFKTGNKIYDEHRFQLAAYRQAEAEESKDKYKASWIIQFDKNTAEFSAHKVEGHKKDFEAFLACLTIRCRLNDLQK